MHSLFGSVGALAVAAGFSAPNAQAAMNKNSPVSRWADEVRKGVASLTAGRILRKDRTAGCAGIARPWAYFGKTAPQLGGRAGGGGGAAGGRGGWTDSVASPWINSAVFISSSWSGCSSFISPRSEEHTSELQSRQ